MTPMRETRDRRSFETQIIDAVRSVSRALGGKYGTSPAIYKSDFDQYEVQLIDAIKGIARTVSGGSLSSVAGGADLSGYVKMDAFQALSRRVKVLEDESFFRLVDGNVTLKPEYQNLWVPGFLAAGGVDSGGSSGGGGASYLKDLFDVYGSSSGVLRPGGATASAGDALVYNATLGWVASPYPVASSSVLGMVKVGSGLAIDGNGVLSTTGGGGTGTVTSVGLSVPTGLSVSGQPVTSNGTIAISYATGYSIPTTAKQTNWDTAYGWGDHASAGYVTIATSQTITGTKKFTSSPALVGANLIFKNSGDDTVYGNVKAGSNYMEVDVGSSNKYMFYNTSSGFFYNGGGVPSGGSSHRWSNVYSVNGDLTGTLTIGSATISYDPTAKALKVSGMDGTTQVGFYCDGFVAAGGVGSGGGGGSVVVDSALSTTSTNPVQNKVITAAIGDVETLLAAL